MCPYLQCLHCGKEIGAVDAYIDNSQETIADMKLSGKILMGFECKYCKKTNYFNIPWEPMYDKFIT